MNTIKLNTIGEAPIKKGGGGGNYVYYRASADEIGFYANYSSVVKAVFNGAYIFLPFADAQNACMSILEWGFDTNLKITNPDNMTIITLGEGIAIASKNWTQITEEEFYKVIPYFTFMDGDERRIYHYDEGMTWEEWIDSPYNDGKFSVMTANIAEGPLPYVHYNGTLVGMDRDYDYGCVKPHRLIQNNLNYSISGSGAPV